MRISVKVFPWCFTSHTLAYLLETKPSFRSKEEWDECVADGRLGQYIPNHPNEMYAEEWESWEEWLGLMRSYDEASTLVRSVLRLQTEQEYVHFIRTDSKRAEGMRIPLKPHIVYRNKGWVSYEEFFGTLQ